MMIYLPKRSNRGKGHGPNDLQVNGRCAPPKLAAR